MLIDGHFEGSSTRSGDRALSLFDRITPRVPTTPHRRLAYQAPGSSMLIDGNFGGSLTRSGGRTLSLLDRITPRGPRGSGLGEYSLRGQHRRLVGAHRRGTASGKKSSKRGRLRTIFFFARWPAPIVDQFHTGRVSIDILPDVALLEIFESYMDGARIDAWHTLVHVCQNWRDVALRSPRRLDLQLCCKARTPVRELLDIWPPLPIVVKDYGYEPWDEGNVIAALEYNDRVCDFHLARAPSAQLEKVLAVVQQPFPTLTRLHIGSQDGRAPVFPASFLGGSTPRLQSLVLDRIPFPGLPTLLLSATHLIHLDLWRIPHSGYVSPEAMVTCLSALTSLESLAIKFESPRSRPDQKSRRLPPQGRILLPVLTDLHFKGVGEYLDELVACIDAPLLDNLEITLFHQLLFDTPQLTQFISRSPKFKTHEEARLAFCKHEVRVTLPLTSGGKLMLTVVCSHSDWKLSSLVDVCSSSIPQALILTVEHLYIIQYRRSPPDWQDDIENGQWLEVLSPFAAVKNLYLSHEFAPRIVPALQELVGERVTEVLPALETLFLPEPQQWEPTQKIVGQFIAVRQLSSHPIAVSRWEN